MNILSQNSCNHVLSLNKSCWITLKSKKCPEKLQTSYKVDTYKFLKLYTCFIFILKPPIFTAFFQQFREGKKICRGGGNMILSVIFTSLYRNYAKYLLDVRMRRFSGNISSRRYSRDSPRPIFK